MRIPVVALLAIAAALCPAQDRLTETLRKGIVQEETRQDLNEAIKSYEAVLAQFGQIAKPGASDRKTAATALFRIAECQRKQGRTEQAAAAYRRILSEFGDQEQLVVQSRVHVGRSDAPSDAAAARQEYRRLLVKARNSLEMQRAYMMERYELGALSQLDLQEAQKKILEKERQLAAYEAGLVQFSPRTPPKGASDEARSHYRAILVEQIRMARTALDTANKRYSLGAIDVHALNDVESALTDLELELAAFDATQDASKGKR